MRRQAVLILLLLVGVTLPMVAQDTTWPSVYYYKFNESQVLPNGREVINFATGNIFHPYSIPTFESSSAPVQWVAGPTTGHNMAWDNGTPGSGTGLNRLIANGGTPLDQDFTIEVWTKTHFNIACNCQPPVGGNCASLGRLLGDYTTSLFRWYIGWYNAGMNVLGGGFTGVDYPLNGYIAGVPVNKICVCDQQWHHLAWVYDSGAGTMQIYVDGNLDQQDTGNTGSSPGTNFSLGGVPLTGSPYGGVIDEFRWWNRTFTAGQIPGLMNGELITPPGGANSCLARFLGTPTSGTTPLLVQFYDFSVTDAGTSITSWAWDLDGDGMTDSTVQNPCWIYDTANTVYNVSLTVGNSAGQSDTFTLNNYVTTGAVDFTLTTCGQADLYLAAPAPPVGWVDGYTLLSFDTSGPPGFGWFFGLYPDLATIDVLQAPAVVGSPLHFLDGPPTQNYYPYTPFSLPPGSAPALVGLTLDAVVVYRDGAGNLMSSTGTARATF